ncbi:hypothetical protein K7H91_20735 [Martelella mediterranea]|uniref:hypothetical protein n=1 Tax=Martelella mediterranea TaxID=293089 RepID=UPI001E2F48EF|nr:hypothetical protein [Martelella mediterranea]MCD1636190.1 hypothetical protein [Martelella mediterranea]
MSQEAQDRSFLKSNTQRPLPPEINFDSFQGLLSGTAEPGLIVNMKSSVDSKLRQCFSTDEGRWQLSGDGPAKWFTIYEVWTSDPDTNAESEKIKFMHDRKSLKLDDVYTSTTTAFGRGKAGTEITAYGPAGQTLGKAFIFGDDGPWSVTFDETLNAGDKVCITAKQFTGLHAMPIFQKAQTFSIDERNVGRISGSGAKSGERILLLDAESQNLIADATVGEDGAWSTSPRKLLEAGARIEVMRVDKNGMATKDLTFSVTPDNCLSPVIDMVEDTYIRGRANPGLKINYTLIRNHEPIASGSAVSDKSAAWEVGDLDLRSGDGIVVTTASQDGTKASQLHASLTIGEYRPGMPYIETSGKSGATGFANPSEFVVASSVNRGVLSWARVAEDGSWTLNWQAMPDWSDEVMLVQFTTYLSLTGSGVNNPSSCFAMRYADDAADPVPEPTITDYTPPNGANNATFSGTDTEDGTTILVVNNTTGYPVGPSSPPTSNQNWVAESYSAVSVGSQCYGIANRPTDGGDIGTNSNPGPYYYVQ